MATKKLLIDKNKKVLKDTASNSFFVVTEVEDPNAPVTQAQLNEVLQKLPTELGINANGKIVLCRNGKPLENQPENVKCFVLDDTLSAKSENGVKNKVIKAAIDKVSSTLESLVKETGTDINIDSDGYLFIEHDGVKISGQKKLVKFKTLFGDQSLVGTGNIDLYNHFLELTYTNGTVNLVIESSSNIDCSGIGTKLKDLLKCSGAAKYYHQGFELKNNKVAQLYWNGTILQVQIGGEATPFAITTVKDSVRTV